MKECLQCGECCKTLKSVLITQDEYTILREHGDPSVTPQGDKLLMALPCVFQHNNKCTIWSDRPCMCRMWHCGKTDPGDPIIEWISDIQGLMKDPVYRAMKTKMEDDAVAWGNAHGWKWSR